MKHWVPVGLAELGKYSLLRRDKENQKDILAGLHFLENQDVGYQDMLCWEQGFHG
jgi:hypothetical protein